MNLLKNFKNKKLKYNIKLDFYGSNDEYDRYLNFNLEQRYFFLCNNSNTEHFQTEFTIEEIFDLMKDKRLSWLNWSGVTFERVE